MRLSTRTRYGARAMVELALRYGQGPVSTATIAACQEVSPKYLEQMLSALRVAGLVQTTRGARGGHSLARRPSEITMRQVYDVLEGTEGPLDCATQPTRCERHAGCVTHELWVRMHQACTAVLDAATLQMLADRARALQPASGMYYI